jgi:hypothetical protein
MFDQCRKSNAFQRAVVLPGHGSQRVSESEKPGPEVAVPQFASAQATSAGWLKRVGRLLYTHNPFYLLSVAFVLHSTRLWLNTRTWPYDPWPLMDIIGGYILLVAIVGFLVIRLGKAWDDARSIFLILLLLFVELSLTFDPVLVAQPRLGLVLLLVGWLMAVAVSEGLLWGLRIRMPLLFRGPYHLLLALLFLYPPLIVAGFHTETVSAIWRIWAFSPIASLALLTLLPAIRRGPDYVRDNGTPWSWPWFPWGLFGFLGLCLGTRAYALTLSFDSVLTQGLPEAMRLQSAFSPFFLVPLMLASGVLLLEAGLVARNRRLQRMALIVPVLAWLSACSLPNPSVPAADFLARFTEGLWRSAMVGSLGWPDLLSLRPAQGSQRGFVGRGCRLAAARSHRPPHRRLDLFTLAGLASLDCGAAHCNRGISPPPRSGAAAGRRRSDSCGTVRLAPRHALDLSGRLAATVPRDLGRNSRSPIRRCVGPPVAMDGTRRLSGWLSLSHRVAVGTPRGAAVVDSGLLFGKRRCRHDFLCLHRS